MFGIKQHRENKAKVLAYLKAQNKPVSFYPDCMGMKPRPLYSALKSLRKEGLIDSIEGEPLYYGIKEQLYFYKGE